MKNSTKLALLLGGASILAIGSIATVMLNGDDDDVTDAVGDAIEETAKETAEETIDTVTGTGE
jgi:hypothetical protein